jgi:hypothetical protein
MADCGTPIDSASDELAYFLCSNARRSRVPEASLKLTEEKLDGLRESDMNSNYSIEITLRKIEQLGSITYGVFLLG